MKIIKVTGDPSGKDYYINLSAISYFTEHSDGAIVVLIATGEHKEKIYTKETPEQIIKLISEANDL